MNYSITPGAYQCQYYVRVADISETTAVASRLDEDLDLDVKELWKNHYWLSEEMNDCGTIEVWYIGMQEPKFHLEHLKKVLDEIYSC